MLFSAKNNQLRSQRGMTMLELLIVLVVIAIGAAVAIPNFSGMIERSQAKGMRYSLFNAFQLARSEALKRRLPVAVCASEDQQGCSNNTEWAKGWLVYVDADRSDDLNGEEILEVHYGEGDLSIGAADDGQVIFRPNGMADAPIVVGFCPKVASQAQVTAVSQTGNVQFKEAADAGCP